MGLWEDAQSAVERAQASRSDEANKRDAEWAEWNARRHEQAVLQQQAIAEFLDGIARLAVSPQKFPVYEWRTGISSSNVRCGAILGWDLYAWTEPGNHGATRFVILSPSGELFDTSFQRGAGGKTFFGRARFTPKPSPLPLTRVEQATQSAHNQVVEIDLPTLLMQRMARAMTTGT